MFDNLYDYICAAVCLFTCAFHLIHSVVSSLKLNKRIDKLCEKCGMPVVEGEEHLCSLTPEQLDKIVALVVSLKGDKNA